jgi:hypothetical protein
VSAYPTGTVTFLFTDIEGSTKLLQELGADYAAVVADHRRILRETFNGAGGREVDTQGDAFFYSLLSETTRALVGSDLPEGVSVRDLGEQKLKDVRAEHLYQLEFDGLPTYFPMLRTEGSSADFGERINRHVESIVEAQLNSVFAGGKPPTAKLAGLTAFGLVTLFVFLGLLVGLAFLIKTVFF